MIRRLIVPLAVAAVMCHAGQSLAQGAIPAPLPGQAGAANAWPVPPVNEATQFTSSTLRAPLTQAGSNEDCAKDYQKLREEAEKRGGLIKAASERHAAADEACKLIGNFAQAEIKMMKYVESNVARCQIPPQIGEQLKRGHEATSKMQQKVCQAAEQVRNREPRGPTGDFWLPGEQL